MTYSPGCLATARAEFLLSGNLTRAVDDDPTLTCTLFQFLHSLKETKDEFWICFSVWGFGGWDQYCRWKLLLQSWQNLSTLRIFGRQTNVLHQRTYLNWTFKFILNKLLIISLFTLITIYLCDDAIVPIWFILMILLCEWSSDLYKKYLFIKT